MHTHAHTKPYQCLCEHVQDPLRPDGENPDIITINGSIPNGRIGADSHGSPSSLKRSPKMRKTRTVGDLPTVQFQESTDGPLSGSTNICDAELRRDSLSPPFMMAIDGTMTPSRKTMEALKKVSNIYSVIAWKFKGIFFVTNLYW